MEEQLHRAMSRRACSHERIKNHSEQDKTSKNNIEFVIASKGPPKAFDSSKETFDPVSAFAEYPVILPWIDAILLRRNDRIVPRLLGYSHILSPSHARSMLLLRRAKN